MRARRARRPRRAGRPMPEAGDRRGRASGMADSGRRWRAGGGRARPCGTGRLKLTAAAAAASTLGPAAAGRQATGQSGPGRNWAWARCWCAGGGEGWFGQGEGEDRCQGDGADRGELGSRTGRGGEGGGGRHSCRMTQCARMSGFRCHAARSAGGQARFYAPGRQVDCQDVPLGCSRPFTSCRPGEMRNERLRALLLERGKTPTSWPICPGGRQDRGAVDHQGPHPLPPAPVRGGDLPGRG